MDRAHRLGSPTGRASMTDGRSCRGRSSRRPKPSCAGAATHYMIRPLISTRSRQHCAVAYHIGPQRPTG